MLSDSTRTAGLQALGALRVRCPAPIAPWAMAEGGDGAARLRFGAFWCQLASAAPWTCASASGAVESVSLIPAGAGAMAEWALRGALTRWSTIASSSRRRCVIAVEAEWQFGRH